MTNNTAMLANAIHAAAAWLERIGATPASAAIVVIHPQARVGVWRPGAASVGMLATIDDAGAELCEATAPAVSEAIEHLPATARELLADAMASVGQLRAVIAPAAEQFRLELIHNGQRVELCTAFLPSRCTQLTH